MSTHKQVVCIAILSSLLSACASSDGPAGSGSEPTGPRPARADVTPTFELVDESQRIDASVVNAHVYGSFVIPFAGGPVAIRSGPANFPGNPPGGPGTCVDGLWYNSRGKATAGTIDHPHPHCVTTGSAVTVVLEPISAFAKTTRDKCPAAGVCEFLHLSDPKTGAISVIQSNTKGLGMVTEGYGSVLAYAIDAATLNGTNVRVGTITIDLTQYHDDAANLFGACFLDDDSFACLPLVITADYMPLATGGVGTPQQISGFLWWAPAVAPYNY